MGALVTTCLKTGRRFETGIDTDKASMEMTPHFTVEVDCPHCREKHVVAKQDLYICELVDGVARYLRAA